MAFSSSSSSTSLSCGNPFVLRTVSPVSLDHGFYHLHLSSSSSCKLIESATTRDFQMNSHAVDSSNNPSLIYSDYLQYYYYYYYSLDPLDVECLLLLARSSPPARILSELKDDDGAIYNMIAAFPYYRNTLSVIFPAKKESEVHQILQETLSNGFSTLEMETFSSGMEIKEAFTCGLREVLVRDGWIVFKSNLAVWNASNQTQHWLNGEPTEVVEFNIQIDTNDQINFLLSPDVIRFRPFKMEELLAEPLKREFNDGGTVILDRWLENMAPDDRQKGQCIVVPSMKEGFVSGCSKLAPKDIDVKTLEEICTGKYGPMLSRKVFYIQVSFLCEEDIIKVWFPSCLVLQRPGVIVTPPHVRKSKIFLALEKIVSCISSKGSESWNWTSARSILLQDSPFTEDKKIFDFGSCVRSLEETFIQTIRRPKPMSFQADIASESIKSSSPVISIKKDNMILLSGTSMEKVNLANSLRIPTFLKKKSKSNDVMENRKEPNKGTSKTASLKKTEEPLSNTTAICKYLQTSGLPRKTKMIKVCFPTGNEKRHIYKSMEADPPAGSKMKPTAVIKNCDIIKPGQNSVLANSSNKTNVVTRKKAPKRESQEKLSTVQQKKKRDSEKITKTTQLVLNPAKVVEDIPVLVSSNGNVTMMVSSQENIVSMNLSTRANTASLLVPPQENIASMIVCQQKNDYFTPIKEVRVAKLPDNSNEKKPLKQSEKKFNVDLSTNEVNKKILSKYGEGKLSDLTVPELKCFLSTNKSKVSGRKEELIQRALLILKGNPLCSNILLHES